MKSARYRAEEFLNDLKAIIKRRGVQSLEGIEVQSVLINSFKEHARDQRHLCAENVVQNPGMYSSTLHGVVINTKAPGE